MVTKELQKTVNDEINFSSKKDAIAELQGNDATADLIAGVMGNPEFAMTQKSEATVLELV